MILEKGNKTIIWNEVVVSGNTEKYLKTCQDKESFLSMWRRHNPTGKIKKSVKFCGQSANSSCCCHQDQCPGKFALIPHRHLPF